jgi:hypothetical protein
MNRTSRGRPPLIQIYKICQIQYRWFDYLQKNRHIPGVKQMESNAWASWQSMLKTLQGLKLTQRELRNRLSFLRKEGAQLTLPLEGHG